MLSKLPLLSLPALVLEVICTHLNAIDRVQLSFCSKRLKSVVKHYEKRSRSGIFVKIDKNGCSVMIFKKCDGMKWVMSYNRDVRLMDGQEFVERKIDDCRSLKVGQLGDAKCRELISVPRDGFFEEDTMTLISYLINLFDKRLNYLEIEFFGNLSFEELFIKNTSFHEVRGVKIHPATFSCEEVTFLFDNLITDDLGFLGSAGKRFSYQKPISSSSVKIADASWMTTEVFMKMAETCKNIQLETAKQITDKDLNMLIKNWLSSDNKSLESISFIRQPASHLNLFKPPSTPAMPSFQQDVVLEGIPTTPGSPKNSNRLKYPLGSRPFFKGRDIRREDGALATVLFELKYGQWSFSFVVWHN